MDLSILPRYQHVLDELRSVWENCVLSIIK
jgi:hypothetical protein